ncbi:MAG TPA: hypothetical protein VI997_05450 [Candidatus Thermoplasmatota archaeon]|nr:hypothetical protein [Candidatus Thermoplasmatota archaeon]
MLMEMPASVEKNGPTMAQIVEIGRILENAAEEPPLSLAEIGRRMSAKRVRHSTVRACVDFLARVGVITTGSKGAQWTFASDARFWKAASAGRSLL